MDDKDTYTIQPRPPADTKPPRNFGVWEQRRLPLLFISCGSLILIVALIGFGFVLYNNFNNADDSTEDQIADVTAFEPSATIYVVGATSTQPVRVTLVTPTRTAEPALPTNTAGVDAGIPTGTFTFSPPTRIPASNTPIPSNTRTPTATPTTTATPTASNTPTITPSATSTPLTPIPTNTPLPTLTPSVTVTPSPTEAQGRLVRLYYDQYSFYAFNASQQDIRSDLFLFEAVDEDGVYSGYRLNGSRWAEFYPYLEDRNCNALEITQSPQWLRPSQCRYYNAILTPQRSSDIVFWLIKSGVADFRVYYDEQEIARCPVGEGTCDIYVP